MSPAEITSAFTIALALAGLIWHAGIIFERVRQVREDHEKLKLYAENMSHQIIKKLEAKMNELELRILAITPRDQWPK
ncbi:MAG TPA: hypothetical protein VJQ82_18050 [Terriglobales bacterium]|nr:hypothetical protein [Terriglobales bacterium]